MDYEYPVWLDYEEDAVAGIEIWRCRGCGAEYTRDLGAVPQFDEGDIIHERDCEEGK